MMFSMKSINDHMVFRLINLRRQKPVSMLGILLCLIWHTSFCQKMEYSVEVRQKGQTISFECAAEDLSNPYRFAGVLKKIGLVLQPAEMEVEVLVFKKK